MLAPVRVYLRKGVDTSQEGAVDRGDHQVDHHTQGAEEEEEVHLHHRRQGAEATAGRADQGVITTHGGFRDMLQRLSQVTYHRVAYRRTM